MNDDVSNLSAFILCDLLLSPLSIVQWGLEYFKGLKQSYCDCFLFVLTYSCSFTCFFFFFYRRRYACEAYAYAPHIDACAFHFGHLFFLLYYYYYYYSQDSSELFTGLFWTLLNFVYLNGTHSIAD